MRLLQRTGLPWGPRPWQTVLVLFYATWMICGLLQVHHHPNGKPCHPHSGDSEYAEMTETEAEVEAEIILLATMPYVMTPFAEVPVYRLVQEPLQCKASLPRSTSLLRGPPVA
ncbi:hypothetical protein GC197_08240 [bacterium]|nr:hypothetical protein [bacterium]